MTNSCETCGGTIGVGYFGVCSESERCRAEELRRLIRNAPDTYALEALWRTRKVAWTQDLSDLAAARRGELGAQGLFG